MSDRAVTLGTGHTVMLLTLPWLQKPYVIEVELPFASFILNTVPLELYLYEVVKYVPPTIGPLAHVDVERRCP
jgi:hypothetical protein